MINVKTPSLVSPQSIYQRYAILIPADHQLRQIDELVDFQFIYTELAHNYCQVDGRNAIDPVQIFKYLLLKAMRHRSDRT